MRAKTEAALSEWQAELAKADAKGGDDPGMTRKELVKELDVCHARIDRLIEQGLRNGTIREGRRRVPRSGGGTYPVPVYQVIKGKPSK